MKSSRKRILIFGSNGMAGHVVSIFLKQEGNLVYNFAKYSILDNTIIGDIKDLNSINKIVSEGNFDYLINCTGILNKLTENNKYESIFVNSIFPHFLVNITSNMATKVIHLSTDCVFSGSKGNYNENSEHDGYSFYDKTKSIGEIDDSKNLTFRNSLIGPDLKSHGVGLFNWFMRQKGNVNGFNNVYWNGVSTIVLAKAISKSFDENLTGVYHLVNKNGINKYELLKLFNNYFDTSVSEILPTPLPISNKVLVNTRNDFDFSIPDYNEMILEMKQWIYQHRAYYPHYFNFFEKV
jgi:dTDP-4-dehydrorhamnose reductase